MSHRQLWMCKTNQTKIGNSQEILKPCEISKVRKYTKLSWQLLDDIPIFYMDVKAADLTNYLADGHYCRVHYIRSLMWSQVTTKYEIRSILKIEKAIDVTG